MQIQPRFQIGDIVYLKTDPDQLQRIVTGLLVRDSGITSYYLSCGERETAHLSLEISNQKTLII